MVFQLEDIFIGNFVELVFDAPCHVYLLCGLEIGISAAICRKALRIYAIDKRILVGVVECGHSAQAVVGFRTLVVKATGKVVGRGFRIDLILHVLIFFSRGHISLRFC